jgi:hypothetical protein
MHPHEATLYALAKRALKGEIRPLRHVLNEFKSAGLLEAPAAQPTSGVLVAPKGVPLELTARLVRLAGVPPWPAEIFDPVKAEYDRDRAHIQRLLEEAKAMYNEKGQ